MVGGPGFDRLPVQPRHARARSRSPAGSSFKIFVLRRCWSRATRPTTSSTAPARARSTSPAGRTPTRTSSRTRGGGGAASTPSPADPCVVELRLRAARPDRRACDKVVDLASGMGITTPLDAVVPSMPLGTKEVHPLDMAAAYAAHRQRRHPQPALLHRPGRGPQRPGALRAPRPTPERGRVPRARPASPTDVLEENVRAAPAPGPGSPASPPPARPAPPRTPATSGSSATPPSWPPRCGSAASATTCRCGSDGGGITGGTIPAESGAGTCAPARGHAGGRLRGTRARTRPAVHRGRSRLRPHPAPSPARGWRRARPAARRRRPARRSG